MAEKYLTASRTRVEYTYEGSAPSCAHSYPIKTGKDWFGLSKKNGILAALEWQLGHQDLPQVSRAGSRLGWKHGWCEKEAIYDSR
jgi:hypothetical protein